MTVAELIEQLKVHDPRRLVIMARDAEGNGYSPLSNLWAAAYRAETTWSGEVGLESLEQADAASGYTDEDVITDGVPALVFSPTN